MKLLVATAALVLQTGVAAQIQASLNASSELAVNGGDTELVLRIEVSEDSELDATVLRGTHLKVSQNNKTIKTIGKRVRGKEHIVAGTTIERVIRVPISLPGDGMEVREVTLTWTGLKDATTTLRVAPAPEKIPSANSTQSGRVKSVTRVAIAVSVIESAVLPRAT